MPNRSVVKPTRKSGVWKTKGDLKETTVIWPLNMWTSTSTTWWFQPKEWWIVVIFHGVGHTRLAENQLTFFGQWITSPNVVITLRLMAPGDRAASRLALRSTSRFHKVCQKRSTVTFFKKHWQDLDLFNPFQKKRFPVSSELKNPSNHQQIQDRRLRLVKAHQSLLFKRCTWLCHHGRREGRRRRRCTGRWRPERLGPLGKHKESEWRVQVEWFWSKNYFN